VSNHTKSAAKSASVQIFLNYNFAHVFQTLGNQVTVASDEKIKISMAVNIVLCELFHCLVMLKYTVVVCDFYHTAN
jgi:hypothetical protein